jgi:type IV pilus assembly protein PilB
VQRLKVMADLDLTQSRRPQDGKFRFVHAGRNVDVRMSVIPTIWGENVVLRLLGGALKITGFEELGCSRGVARTLDDASKSPHGLVLVTGPTGSGKSTTLYTALTRINSPERNVVAIEDPVEYRLPMVRHVQVNSEIGLSFAGALRAIMRQDPDVILLGEIRDEETARIAVQAALTGHLVLSTLHTNDAPGAIARLQNFNCPSFAINASLVCTLAQRLVRKVCESCAKPYTPDPTLMRRFMPPDQDGQFRHGAGCPKCSNLGLRGRIGIFECIRMTRRLQDAVESGASTGALRALAVRDGMVPMWQDGVEKARLGLTTLEEIASIAAGSLDDDALESDQSDARAMAA